MFTLQLGDPTPVISNLSQLLFKTGAQFLFYCILMLGILINNRHMTKPADKKRPDLPAPDKVTLAWLIKHVPFRLWLAGIGLLAASFWAGFESSDISIIREIRGKSTPSKVFQQSSEGFVHFSAIDPLTSLTPGAAGIVRSGGTQLRISASRDADGTDVAAGVRLKIIDRVGAWLKVRVPENQERR